jgi:DICT domain-containing protein
MLAGASPGGLVDEGSLYAHVRQVADQSAIPLEQLGAVEPRGDEGMNGAAAFRSHTRGLARFCRISEQIVVDRKLRDARVQAGFQALSRVRPVQRRFEQIAQTAAQLVVFGLPDDRPRGVGTVPLSSNDSLTREWFLVVRSRAYQCLLVARDLDGFSFGRLHERRFDAIATYKSVLIEAAASWLERHPGERRAPAF